MHCTKCNKKNATTKCSCGSYSMYVKKRVVRSVKAR